MNAGFTESANWWRAMTLAERVASLRRQNSSCPLTPEDSARADRRLKKWKCQPPFDTGGFFAGRLRADAMDESELHRLLGEPVDAVRSRQTAIPKWLGELAKAFSIEGSHLTDVIGRPDADAGIEGFVAAVAPLILIGRSRLRQSLRSVADRIPRLPFDPATAETLLLDDLARRLLTISVPTLVLELNVARVRGLLAGETAAERFRNFLLYLRQPTTTLAILEEYPVLARLLTESVDRWATFCLEFLQHLSEDWQQLREELLSGQDPGPLTGVEVGAGDAHREGRSVVVTAFRSGFKVVYKPRSLSIDCHFQELLAWMNERGAHAPFRVLKVMDRGTHGWMEFVESRGCREPDELRRFYQRQGGHLAVLYALEAVDFHSENLVASGEWPVLIDLEFLFHPQTARPGIPGPGRPGDGNASGNVLGVGLLPFLVGGNDSTQGVDLSGLGRRPGQISPFDVPQWEDPASDTMRLVNRPLIVPGAKNRPSLGGQDVEPAEYLQDISIGFSQIYDLLLDHRGELLAPGGPLDTFASDEVRFIARPTQTYAALLQASWHPDALRDALDRDRVLDFLWIQAASQPYLTALIAAERRDLLIGDVPLFNTRPCSRNVWNSAGICIPEYFEEPAMAAVQRRMRSLSAEDLKLQLGAIRDSFSH